MSPSALLELALTKARLGLGEGGIPIGAALFGLDARLLGRGHNRGVQDDDPAMHAETTALPAAGRQRDYRTRSLPRSALMSGNSTSATSSQPRAGKASVGMLPATPAPPGNRCGPIPAPGREHPATTNSRARWRLPNTTASDWPATDQSHWRWCVDHRSRHRTPKRTDYIGRKSDAGARI